MCLDDYYVANGLWLEEGYEGSIWRADAAYEQKRSKALRKRKEFVDDEFELVALEEGLGNWSGMAKRAICRLPDGRTFGAGIKGSQERAREGVEGSRVGQECVRKFNSGWSAV